MATSPSSARGAGRGLEPAAPPPYALPLTPPIDARHTGDVMKCTPMLYVSDVRASTSFYCELLGATHDHDGDEFDRVMVGDEVLLMLHARDTHGHGEVDVDGPLGGGVQIWLSCDDVRAVHGRARKLGAERLTEPQVNPLAHWTEFTLRDPDGYAIAVWSLD